MVFSSLWLLRSDVCSVFHWLSGKALPTYDKANKHVTSTHTPLHNTIYANAKSSVFTEQYDRCGNSTEQSQAPDDGYINVRNMMST